MERTGNFEIVIMPNEVKILNTVLQVLRIWRLKILQVYYQKSRFNTENIQDVVNVEAPWITANTENAVVKIVVGTSN